MYFKFGWYVVFNGMNWWERKVIAKHPSEFS